MNQRPNPFLPIRFFRLSTSGLPFSGRRKMKTKRKSVLLLQKSCSETKVRPKMKTLYIATHNRHKKEEIQDLFASNAQLSARYAIESLDALDFHGEIPETADTLEGNALQKARYVHEKFGVNCFADDTGLEVEALGNRPGVFSARYANMPADFEENGKVTGEALERPDPTFDQNIDRLLAHLGPSNRKARFRSVICLILDGKTYYFEGKSEGTILFERQGKEGFGYDPVFRPDGFEKSFAQLSMTEKNAISHRGKAVAALMAFLGEQEDFRP